MDERQNLEQAIAALGDPFVVAVQVPLRAVYNRGEPSEEGGA